MRGSIVAPAIALVACLACCGDIVVPLDRPPTDAGPQPRVDAPDSSVDVPQAIDTIGDREEDDGEVVGADHGQDPDTTAVSDPDDVTDAAPRSDAQVPEVFGDGHLPDQLEAGPGLADETPAPEANVAELPDIENEPDELGPTPEAEPEPLAEPESDAEVTDTAPVGAEDAEPELAPVDTTEVGPDVVDPDVDSSCNPELCANLAGPCEFTQCVAGECIVTDVEETGTPCDDGNPCTVGETCNKTGTCGGLAYSCVEDLECAAVSCDGQGGCVFDVLPGFCLIEGDCFAEGDSPKGGLCHVCDPQADIHDWTALAVGTPCGSTLDNACTAPDTCNSKGQCQSNNAADGTPCGGLCDACMGGACMCTCNPDFCP